MFNFRKLVFLAAVLLLAACDSGQGSEGGQAAAGGPGAGAPPPPSVTVARPLVGPVDEWREFSGKFEATDTVEVRSRISGYLMKVLFTDGQIVHKGDPLFEIDPRQIEATIRQKEADLNLAKSQTTEATNAFNRADALFKTGDISQAVLDQRRAAMDSANAAVASAKAAVDSARVDLVYTKIAAPITGRISSALVTVGNLVTPGQEVLTTIVSLDPIYFYFDVDEKAYLTYARATAGNAGTNNPGVPTMVALTDETDYTHPGTIDFIDNQLSNSTGTIRARAVLKNEDMFLTPGMFGRARIRTSGSENGILIPDEAVIIDQSRKMVFIVDDKNMVATRTIETGGLDRGLRVVTKGLDGSEWVVINGIQRAHEGAPVTPEKSEVKANVPPAGQEMAPPDNNQPVDTLEEPAQPAGQADTKPADNVATPEAAPAEAGAQ